MENFVLQRAFWRRYIVLIQTLDHVHQLSQLHLAVKHCFKADVLELYVEETACL